MGSSNFFGIVEDLDGQALQELLDDFPGMSDEERRQRAKMMVVTFAPEPSEVAIHDVLASELELIDLVLIGDRPVGSTTYVDVADIIASALITTNRCGWYE